MTEPNLCEDRSSEYDREWANIDELSTDLPEPKALRSPDLGLSALVGATNPFGSLHQRIICLLNTTRLRGDCSCSLLDFAINLSNVKSYYVIYRLAMTFGQPIVARVLQIHY